MSLWIPLLTIGLGALISPLFLSVFAEDPWRDSSTAWLSTLWALPFAGSLVVLMATRAPRAAFFAAVLPLVVAVMVHAYVVLAARVDPLAGVALYFLAWPNLLVMFPLGIWIGVRQYDKHEAT